MGHFESKCGNKFTNGNYNNMRAQTGNNMQSQSPKLPNSVMDKIKNFESGIKNQNSKTSGTLISVQRIGPRGVEAT